MFTCVVDTVQQLASDWLHASQAEAYAWLQSHSFHEAAAEQHIA